MMYRLFYIQCFKLYFEVSEDFQTLSLTLFSNVEILRFDVFIARGSLFFLWQLFFYSVAGSSSSTTSFFSKFFLDDFFPLFFLFFFCFFWFLFFLVGSSFMPDLVSVAVIISISVEAGAAAAASPSLLIILESLIVLSASVTEAVGANCCLMK